MIHKLTDSKVVSELKEEIAKLQARILELESFYPPPSAVHEYVYQYHAPVIFPPPTCNPWAVPGRQQ